MCAQIKDLPNLSENDFDANADFLIVQKPGADTYKMSMAGAHKTSLSSLIMFDDEIIVDSWPTITVPTRKTYSTNPILDKDGNQVTRLNLANFVYCSILQVGQAHPRLGFSYFSSLDENNSPVNEVFFDLSYYDRAKEDTWYFLIPILNNNIELNVSYVHHGSQFTQFKFHGYC
tara:strand:+ start:5065 stop:5586 length:522 start_codon:yes stop_codon:yes gene_type:complete